MKKNEKSAIFEIEKPFEMGPNFLNSQISRIFEGEKSLDMGRGFKPWATHPVKNNFSIPSPRFRMWTTLLHDTGEFAPYLDVAT